MSLNVDVLGGGVPMLDAGSSSTQEAVNEQQVAVEEAQKTNQESNDYPKDEKYISVSDAWTGMVGGMSEDFERGKGVMKREANKRLDVLANDGLLTPDGKKIYYSTWLQYVSDYAKVHDLDSLLREKADRSIKKSDGTTYKSLSETRYTDVYGDYKKRVWNKVGEEVGRGARLKEDMQSFVEGVGETLGDVAGGFGKGLFQGLGGGKILLIAGLGVVALVMFASSDRGAKTASNVGQVTGGVKP
jgi:hypothetical protein